MRAKKTLMTLATGVSLASSFVGAQAASAATTSSSPSIPIALQKVEKCESGGDPTAQNPTSSASGLFQDETPTWQSLPGTAGYANAKDAPVSVQIQANLALYARDGLNPWLASKSCWSQAGATGVNTTTGGGLASGASSTSNVSNTAGVTTATTGSDASDGVQAPTNPGVLSDDEKKAISTIEAQQKQQSWWTPQAQSGLTIQRTVVTGEQDATVHTQPNFTSASTTDNLSAGTKVVGHYVNVDWFEITEGAHAGSYINSDFLERLDDVHNGQLSAAQLANVPLELRASLTEHNASLGLSTAKSLIELNAAFRAQFGHNLQITEGYRDLSTQQAYLQSLGSKFAAQPGTSNHGLGNAIDFATAGLSNTSSAEYAWMTKYDAAYGFNNPSETKPTAGQTVEWWHYNFIG